MDVQHFLFTQNPDYFFPPAVCFYEGEIPTDKGAESRDLCKRAISWAGLSRRTDSAPDFSPSALTATIKATAAFAPNHCTALAGSTVASYTPKRGQRTGSAILSRSFAPPSLVFQVSPWSFLFTPPYANLPHREPLPH